MIAIVEDEELQKRKASQSSTAKFTNENIDYFRGYFEK